MSEVIEVLLPHEQEQWHGVVRFDGTIVEFLGFNEVRSVRIHIHEIDSAELSTKKGMLSQPHIMFRGHWTGGAYNHVIDPPDELVPELEELVAAINKTVGAA